MLYYPNQSEHNFQNRRHGWCVVRVLNSPRAMKCLQEHGGPGGQTDRRIANCSIAYLFNQCVQSKLNGGWRNEAEGSYPHKFVLPRLISECRPIFRPLWQERLCLQEEEDNGTARMSVMISHPSPKGPVAIYSGNNCTWGEGSIKTLQGWIDTGSKMTLILGTQSIIGPLLE